MAPDDFLLLEMLPEWRLLSVSQLLDLAFPADLDEQGKVAARFDLRANPDLPDIYAVFLAVCDEWRDWRCALRITASPGQEVALDERASSLIPSDVDRPVLSLHLRQKYRALEYAVRHGLWPSRDELLDWMRALTTLYFIDKHEVKLLSPESEGGTMDAEGGASALRQALGTLQAEGFIAVRTDATDTEQPSFSIARAGRRFIASLLSETEELIDQFDHFKDTVIDAAVDMVEFDTGRGEDLRVEAFLAEGIDPVRAVFLLRLYDGYLDHRLGDWQDALEDKGFFEDILEPVVNRDGASRVEMELVIESGISLLEERQEQARREEAEQEILRRAQEGETPSP